MLSWGEERKALYANIPHYAYVTDLATTKDHVDCSEMTVDAFDNILLSSAKIQTDSYRRFITETKVMSSCCKYESHSSPCKRHHSRSVSFIVTLISNLWTCRCQMKLCFSIHELARTTFTDLENAPSNLGRDTTYVEKRN